MKQKSKHNYWINGLEKGESFFNSIYILGGGLFYAMVFMTCVWFWVEFYVSHVGSPYANMAATIILVFRLIFILVVAGLLFKYLCHFSHVLLSDKEEKKLLEVGKRKYGNTRQLQSKDN